jgi:ribosomal protein S18 acetylase RimI-like enzyme
VTAGTARIADAELYRRGAETLLGSWAAIACGAREAAVLRLPGVAAAVFPHEPERSIYNNALIERDLAPAARTAALDAMEAAYAAAGVTRFAAWTHETDRGLRTALEARGYAIDTTTRAMGMDLNEDIRRPRPDMALERAPWSAYLRHLGRFGLPAGLLAGVDPDAFELLLATDDGETVATALAFDADGDRGVYNVGTLEHARRRGLGTALTALLVHDAADRGLRTASLQSTEMAERVYAAVGFRDLGRILEYAPDRRGPRIRAAGDLGRTACSSS